METSLGRQTTNLLGDYYMKERRRGLGRKVLASSSKQQANSTKGCTTKWPSVLVAFVEQALRSKTCELVPLARLKDSVCPRTNGLKTLLACCLKRLSGQDFLHIGLDRDTLLAALCRQFG